MILNVIFSFFILCRLYKQRLFLLTFFHITNISEIRLKLLFQFELTIYSNGDLLLSFFVFLVSLNHFGDKSVKDVTVQSL